MGSQCSRATATEPTSDVSILVDQLTIIDARPSPELQTLRMTLRRNSIILKGRMGVYIRKMNQIDPADSRGKIYISEHARAAKLLTEVRRIREAIDCMV
jgi:hypothetical protein